ncbi:cache domain-containing sensor histidine kinase [Cohnella panacarvi]|uniref:cache domain-containing sensor histidine kinase n=1 Tax=Cohnella panacarvi TaxID=400776 RepID=UPI00047BD5D0|nr:sensor histidine kinase [Cohnella panacarvi]
MKWNPGRWTRLPSPLNRMEGKLFIVFLFLIILPIGALSYISAERYTDSIERNTITYVSQISDTMISKLDDYMEDMKKISIIPSYLDEIKEGLKISNKYYEMLPMHQNDPDRIVDDSRGGLSGEELQLLRRVEGSIYFLNNIKSSGSNSVYLFDRYGHYYFTTKSDGIRKDLTSVYEEWKALAYAQHGTPVLVSTQEVSGRSGSRYVFSVVREIIDTNFESLGMIAVDANIDVIENIVKDLDDATQGSTLIVDNTGRVVFDSEKKFLAQNMQSSELLRQASGESGSFHTNIDGESVLSIYRESRNTGWKIFVTIPQGNLMGDAMRIRNVTVASAIAITGFALFISMIFTFTLTKPLRSLVRLMKKVQTGNLDVTFPVKGRDEIGVVGGAFNRMIDRVKSLLHDVYMAGRRKNEAELEALQNQINPHFIYNTLESIRMTAVINDDSEVSDMAQLLGKLLRYGIGSGTEKVSLAMELEHLEMYLQLLNYRYGDNRFELRMPDGNVDMNMPIMKLLFQPIVENAVYHGMDETKPKMTIRLKYDEAGADRLFTISDDGVGMDQAALRRLRSTLNNRERKQSEGGGGIGLRNVNERLKLRFGEGYGISIDSELGVGTNVTVKIPIEPSKGGRIHG